MKTVDALALVAIEAMRLVASAASPSYSRTATSDAGALPRFQTVRVTRVSTPTVSALVSSSMPPQDRSRRSGSSVGGPPQATSSTTMLTSSIPLRLSSLTLT